MYRVLHYTGENVLAPEPICTSRIYGFLANERLATYFLLEESKNKKEGCNKGFYILIEQYVSTVSHSFKRNIALSILMLKSNVRKAFYPIINNIFHFTFAQTSLQIFIEK